jgi:tRNA U34 2-thiouridine synthase MnmA/TrmU
MLPIRPRTVCDKLKVPLETLSLQKEYWEEVVQYTLREAGNGRTPNPDIMCNSRIKFGTFIDRVGKYVVLFIF